jgi:hypothetical protein
MLTRLRDAFLKVIPRLLALDTPAYSNRRVYFGGKVYKTTGSVEKVGFSKEWRTFAFPSVEFDFHSIKKTKPNFYFGTDVSPYLLDPQHLTPVSSSAHV